MSDLPAIPQIRTFEDAKRALENIRAYFKGIEGDTLVGPAGPRGLQGGAGAQWYYSNGAPVELHNDGDFDLDLDSGDVYQQQTGAWVIITNIMGPPGPIGGEVDGGAPDTTYFAGTVDGGTP